MMVVLTFPCITFFNYINGTYTFGVSLIKYNNFLINYFKRSTNWRVDTVMEITVIDLLTFYTTKIATRFLLIYLFISYTLNYRLQLIFTLTKNQIVETITKNFFSANWPEREIWDMFGIFFISHKDLRRILSDYGFTGFPLRKDFPISGFLENLYNETLKRIIYRTVELSQTFRLFKFNSKAINTFN